jgi:hypothetical protein
MANLMHWFTEDWHAANLAVGQNPWRNVRVRRTVVSEGLEILEKTCSELCIEHGLGCDSRVALPAAYPPDHLN